jgi:hypothetical protein
MNLKKIGVAIGFLLLGIVTTALFWQQTYLLTFLIVSLVFVKHLFVPVKKEWFWFFLIGGLGTATESLIMYLGSNPWSYTTVTILNFPIWLVALWGLAGVIFVTLYEGIMKIK